MNFEGSNAEKQARIYLATFGIDYDAIIKEQFVNVLRTPAITGGFFSIVKWKKYDSKHTASLMRIIISYREKIDSSIDA